MKTELTDWKFKYIEGSCTLGRPENGNVVTLPAEGTVTGLGKTGDAFFGGYDDSSWKKVSVPHDWAVTMPFSKSYSSGTGYLAGGIGWYRCHFTLTEEEAKKHVRLFFEGVYKKSAVWCNSNYLGKWAYGFTPFEFDLSGLVRPGDNIIAVKVMHPDIADSRWYTGSGIIRKVYLNITDDMFVKTDGVFFSVEDVKEGFASVAVSAEVRNDGPETREKRLVHELSDPAGKSVLVLESSVKLSPGEEKTVLLKGSVKNPRLWTLERPSLYTLRTSLSGDDVVENSVGIRTIRFDADKGFFLNGKSVKFKGVCVHDDAGCLGNAVPAAVWRRRLDILKECGCNAIRMAHNPHLRELYHLCDQIGFLVMDEVFDEWEGCKNKWSTGHNVYPPVHQGYAEDFHEWYAKDVAAFVRRARNCPSVVMWSIGNEIDYPNDPYVHPSFAKMTGNNDANKPEAEKQYNPQKPDIERLSVIAARLAAEVRKHDVTRPVTLASAFPELTSTTGYFKALDLVGYNYKEHLYEKDHARFPLLPIFGSENSHGYEQWKLARDKEYISGQFIWTGIDFLGETVGWPCHGSKAGILTTAGFKKTQFWHRKSMWSAEPFVKIVAAPAILSSEADVVPKLPEYRWNSDFEPVWSFKQGQKIDLRVFSTAETVTLYLGESDVGMFRKDEQTGYISVTMDYQALPLKVVGDDGASDCLAPEGDPSCLEASVYEGGCDSEKAEVLQVELSLKDKDGNVVHGAACSVSVEVSSGTLLGIDNGDQSDNTSYSSRTKTFYKGHMVVYVRPDSLAENCIVTFNPDLSLCPLRVRLR
ncbi:MAG: beta galactosidase jelly roll domain-containing protein [Treponemataceae bacterium]|nr:beta galactosidase jelly roll domain-containing protein [Treponemataceae bacterium]